MRGEIFLGVLVMLGLTHGSPFSGLGSISEFELRDMLAKMGNDLVDLGVAPSRRMDLQFGSEQEIPEISSPLEYDELALPPSLRDREYLSHSTLLSGNPFSDGRQSKPKTKPVQQPKQASDLKADGVLPAYCNPPNPCPLGYTAKDGCLEEFENTAGFSHDYQALQECMCDTEHMFQCPDSNRDSEITALARSIQNEGVLDSTVDKIMENMNLSEGAGKFHSKKNDNPFLQGEKLPIAAKKGFVW